MMKVTPETTMPFVSKEEQDSLEQYIAEAAKHVVKEAKDDGVTPEEYVRRVLKELEEETTEAIRREADGCGVTPGEFIEQAFDSWEPPLDNYFYCKRLCVLAARRRGGNAAVVLLKAYMRASSVA